MKNNQGRKNVNKKKSITIENSVYFTQFTNKFLRRKKWKKANPNQIISIIPGTVLEVNTHEGEKVKMGEPVMVIEAMKMRNTIEMPFDGKIVKINVKVGQAITKNQIMIEIKPT